MIYIFLLLLLLNSFVFYKIGVAMSSKIDDEKERSIRVNSFSLGRRHGIRIATIIAKESMGRLKKYVTVDRPYVSNEHNGDIVNICFSVDRNI